jgi:glycine/D-amino acid oxidase-like deaminating enzyme
MRTEHHYDIAIIGNGITGLSAAYHLMRLGTKKICFFIDKNAKDTTRQSAGLLTVGLLDNISRITHRHGLQTAQEVWDWSCLAYERLIEFCLSENIPVKTGERRRWIVSQEELKEAQTAVKIFDTLGYNARLETQNTPNGLGSILATQLESKKASILTTSQLLSKLSDSCSSFSQFGRATSVMSGTEGITIKDAAGNHFTAEAAIIASGLGTNELVPSVAPFLVSYADQWHTFNVERSLEEIGLVEGSFFSWHHTHYWGGCTNHQQIHLGGARFLRPLAGFEATEANQSESIKQHLRESWNSMFPNHKIVSTLGSGSALDCWPSDELPIIGPIAGEPRILIATGYMGLGLGLGFYAGRCLAELLQGLRPPLPRKLWPERFRNLPD